MVSETIMKIMAWNCRGVGSPLTIPQLKEVTRLHCPNLLLLGETKNKEKFVNTVRKELKFDELFCVNPIGRAGGIAVMWNKELTILNMRQSQWFIEIHFVNPDDNMQWWCIFVHASTKVGVRRDRWQELSIRKSDWGDKWLILGDFNDIVANSEKWGGRDREEWEFRTFRDFIASNDLIDLGFEGNPWTWRNNWNSKGEIKERLDRILTSYSWRIQRGKAKCTHVEKEASDHCILLLDTVPSKKKVKSRFCFDRRWLQHQEVEQIVRMAWGKQQSGSKLYQVSKKIKECRKALLQWNRETKTIQQKGLKT